MATSDRVTIGFIIGDGFMQPRSIESVLRDRLPDRDLTFRSL